MNIFMMMLSSYRDSNKLTFGNKIKLAITIVILHVVLRVSTSVLFISLSAILVYLYISQSTKE